MTDIHIDDFYKDAAKILLQLYRIFPRKDLLLVEDIAGPDTPDEYGLHSPRHQACFGTMIWLAESGYLSYADTIRQEGIDQAVLSHKSFTLLCARASQLQDDSLYTDKPVDLDDLPQSVVAAQQSNVYLLREAVKSGSSLRIGQLMQQLLRQSKDH